MTRVNRLLPGCTLLLTLALAGATWGDPEDGEILIIDEEPTLIIETDDTLEIDAGDSLLIEEDSAPSDPRAMVAEEAAAGAEGPAASPFSLQVDDLWGEYGYLPDSGAASDHLGYLHARATAAWEPQGPWEVQLQARADGYLEWGGNSVEEGRLDYGESFVRYTAGNARFTAGAQQVLWGRIDEFPPIDRLSTQDVTRFILDDLEDRRRASAVLRWEQYSGNAKLDVVLLPLFREAELPEKDSVWFPIDQDRGRILGLRTNAASAAVIRNARIRLDEPDDEGGAGIRFSNLTASLDYGVSIQRGRPTLPYFTYNAKRNTLDSVYPRTWILGGDVGREALGGTLRFEAAWLSDTPVTRRDGRLETVESLSWGAAFEFFPGDGDARINLQLMGNNLFDTPSVLDRTEVYAFTGSWESPFANETWRGKVRFYLGIGDHDVYVNPELAYTGWPSQEIYVEAHYFEGGNATLGGFHEDHSLVAVGWRIRF